MPAFCSVDVTIVTLYQGIPYIVLVTIVTSERQTRVTIVTAKRHERVTIVTNFS